MSYKTLISRLEAALPIVDDKGKMQDHFRAFATQVSNSGLIIGTGSPEGVVEADPGRMYMDDTGTAGNILYIKRDQYVGGDRSQGWILI